MALNITQEQYNTAKAYADAGDYKGGWNYLALVDDNYADNAAAVTSGNATGIDVPFEILVQKHWENTAPGAYADKFDQVATQHFQQYVKDIKDNGFSLPNKQQIEESYRTAVTDAGLPPDVAFDGVFTRSIGEVLDGLYPGHKTLDWPDVLGIEDERQTESHVFDDLSKAESWETLIKDMVDTAAELANRGLNEIADTWDKMIDDVKKAFIDFELELEELSHDISDTINDLFTAARNWFQRRDPLTMDLDSDGLETVGIDAANPILFDHDGDGVANATGWIKPDDGFLVLDRNGNGLIDNGTELFGDSTPLVAGGTAADGFAALAQEDTNGDGLVNAGDANWDNLRVWQDANSDGITDAGELHSLESLGITGFHVAKSENTTRLANGNQIADLGSFIRDDGTEGTVGQITGGMADIDLADNPFYRSFSDTVPLTEQAQALPNMQGSGMVRDLREAVSLSPALGSALTEYAAADTKAAQMALVDSVISQWAASSGFQTSIEKAAAQNDQLLFLVPGLNRYDVLGGGFASSGGSSTGSTGLSLPTPEEIAKLEALKAQQIHITEILGLLEKFNGMTFVNVEEQGVRTGANALLAPWSDSSTGTSSGGLSSGSELFVLTLSATQINFIERAYESLRQSIYDGLLLQTRLKPYMDTISLTVTDAGIGLDFTGTTALFQTRYDQAPGEAMRDLLDLQRIQGTSLNGSGWDGLEQLRGWLGDAANSAAPALSATLVTALTEFGYPSLHTQGDGSTGNDTLIGNAANDEKWRIAA